MLMIDNHPKDSTALKIEIIKQSYGLARFVYLNNNFRHHAAKTSVCRKSFNVR